MNLANTLQRSAFCAPTKAALICGDTTITYQEFDHISGKIAAALIEDGLTPGDRVALSCPNLPFFPLIYYGIQKAGGVVVPLNVLLKHQEIEYHLKDAHAKFFFCFEGTAELPMAKEAITAFERVEGCQKLIVMAVDDQLINYKGYETLSHFMSDHPPISECVVRQGHDNAVILYTSGTTGYPKGAELTHSNMMSNAFIAQHLLSASNDDRHLVTLPLFHSFGQTLHMNSAILTGSTLVLVPRFEPTTVLSLIEQEQITIFAGVPTMYIGLLGADDEYDISSLRIAISGGSSLHKEVIEQFESRFKVPILEGYGLSETSPIASFNYADSRVPGSVGKPVLGVEIRIVDEQGTPLNRGEKGEIIIRGHNVMKGYVDRPEETEAVLKSGWFYTGDIGQQDESGNLYIVDRSKDMIIRGGMNVYPREVEEVFAQHPDIAMVAVLGVPDSLYGEEIKAVVVPKKGAEVDGRALVQWGKEQCASYKYPRTVEVVSSLPLSATGKILKRELRALFTH
nr:long-chain fatty acid--CoA ligase [Vibrio sp. Of7-15]